MRKIYIKIWCFLDFREASFAQTRDMSLLDIKPVNKFATKCDGSSNRLGD